VARGIVINSELYEARLYDRKMTIKQCFNCQQWGHTQGACAKQARCGQCAGPHNTKDCLKERISCANCGKAHRSWQRSVCPAFQAYHTRVQGLRADALISTASIQNAGAPTAPTGRAPALTPVSFATRKRPQENAQPAPRRVGRPSYIEAAARDPTQRLLVPTSSAPVTSRQDTPSQEVVIDSDNEL
jgi:hypothetical protein